MNPIIKQYLDNIETYLIQIPVVTSYQILRREIAATDGKLRVKVMLSDGSSAELFEYVAESRGHIHLLKYSLHWQDANGKLVKRWDNAPHHPNLPNAPHHIHSRDGSIQDAKQIPDILLVIVEIEQVLG